MKIGDKILCKKKFVYRANLKTSWVERIFTGKTLFKKGKYYEILNLHDGNSVLVVTTEFGKSFSITQAHLKTHFYTPKEIRKLKLQKIKKSR